MIGVAEVALIDLLFQILQLLAPPINILDSLNVGLNLASVVLLALGVLHEEHLPAEIVFKTLKLLNSIQLVPHFLLFGSGLR